MQKNSAWFHSLSIKDFVLHVKIWKKDPIAMTRTLKFGTVNFMKGDCHDYRNSKMV